MNQKIFILIFTAFIIIFLNSSCKNSQSNALIGQNDTLDSLNKDFLTIVIDSVKAFDKPDGNIVMRLKSGVKCKIITKGNLDLNKKIDDNWYLVEYNGKKVWILGSNTSLRLESEFDLFLRTFINQTKDTLSIDFSNKFLNGEVGFIPIEFEKLDNNHHAALLSKKNKLNEFEILLVIYDSGVLIKKHILYKANIDSCRPPQVFFTSSEFIKLVGTVCASSTTSILYFQILEDYSIRELKSSIVAKSVDELLPKIKAELKVESKSMSDECNCTANASVKIGHMDKKFIFFSITLDECSTFCNSSNYSFIAMPDSGQWTIKFEEKGVIQEIYESGIPDKLIVVFKETRTKHLFERIEIQRVYLFDTDNHTMDELNLNTESCLIIAPEQYGCNFCIKNTSHHEELIFRGNPVDEVVKKISNIIYDGNDDCKIIDQSSSLLNYKWSAQKKVFELNYP